MQINSNFFRFKCIFCGEKKMGFTLGAGYTLGAGQVYQVGVTSILQ
jgi:hypothetical protein